MSAPLMTVNEVAERLKINRATVYRLCAKPDGLRSYKVGGCTRFKPEEVDEYLERCLVKPPQRQEGPNITRFQYKPGMRGVSL